MTTPRAGSNGPVQQIVLGMHDYDTGLDVDSLEVLADFPVNGLPARTNLAKQFQAKPDGVWVLPLTAPLANLPKAGLSVAVRDRQGNTTRIERTFSVK